MPMILVKKNPRGKVIRELSTDESPNDFYQNH